MTHHRAVEHGVLRHGEPAGPVLRHVSARVRPVHSARQRGGGQPDDVRANVAGRPGGGRVDDNRPVARVCEKETFYSFLDTPPTGGSNRRFHASRFQLPIFVYFI